MILAVACGLAAGCGDFGAMEGDVPTREKPAEPFPELEKFRWGNAQVTIGMTKQEVLEQIKISGLAAFGGKFGIRLPSEEMIAVDRWDLSYGNMSGAAPGGGLLRIEFSEGKVASIRAMAAAARAAMPGDMKAEE